MFRVSFKIAVLLALLSASLTLSISLQIFARAQVQTVFIVDRRESIIGPDTMMCDANILNDCTLGRALGLAQSVNGTVKFDSNIFEDRKVELQDAMLITGSVSIDGMLSNGNRIILDGSNLGNQDANVGTTPIMIRGQEDGTCGVILNLLNLELTKGIVGYHGGGGGIYNYWGTLRINNVKIYDNRVVGGPGGGIYNQKGCVVIERSEISNNHARGEGLVNGDGGGIFSNEGSIEITDSTIKGNTSYATADTGPIVGLALPLPGGGGGIASVNTVIKIKNSRIMNNKALTSQTSPITLYYGAYGGGIYMISNNKGVSIHNSSIVNNSAYGGGGNLFVSGNVYIKNSSIIDGEAPRGGNIFIGYPRIDQVSRFIELFSPSAGTTSLYSSTIAFARALNTTVTSVFYQANSNFPSNIPKFYNTLFYLGLNGSKNCDSENSVLPFDLLQGSKTNLEYLAGAYSKTCGQYSLYGNPDIIKYEEVDFFHYVAKIGANSAALNLYDPTGFDPALGVECKVGEKDQLGQKRWAGANCDIGAFEYQAVPTPNVRYVTTTDDTLLGNIPYSCTASSCTLRAAVNVAAPGDEIRFKLPAGTIALEKEIEIRSPIKIIGTGTQITISGRGLNRIFKVLEGAGDVDLVDLHLTSGLAAGVTSGGAVFVSNNVTLEVNRVTFSENQAHGGGAIFVDNNARLNISNSIFRSNMGILGAGAIHNSGVANVKFTTFYENRTSNSSVADTLFGSSAGTTRVSSSVFGWSSTRNSQMCLGVSDEGYNVVETYGVANNPCFTSPQSTSRTVERLTMALNQIHPTYYETPDEAKGFLNETLCASSPYDIRQYYRRETGCDAGAVDSGGAQSKIWKTNVNYDSPSGTGASATPPLSCDYLAAGQDCTLREAVAAALPQDVISFL
jgi:predicted outer membrane repeat protein